MNTREHKEPVIGVIAEYNPLHNGHAHHLGCARQCLDAPVAVVLSSSFTQRGEPTLADKWARTEMALQNGADLVFELPFAYACNAAPEFARGAVDVLAATGFVTHLSFGMEKTDYPLDTIFSILIEEPPSFKDCLRKNLKIGQSYPKALANALDEAVPGGGAFLSTPNNTLAVAYLLHVRRRGYALTPLPVQRVGGGYHDETQGAMASATAIRKALNETWITEALPPSSLSILLREREKARLCLDTSGLWTLLRGLLLRTPPQDLRRCAGMDEGLENLFLKNYPQARSYEDFIGRCVCARYTRSRLQRQVVRLLVGVDRWVALALSRSSPPYIRVLGANATGRRLLRKNAGGASAQIVTRLPAALGAAAEKASELEFRASKLRELLLPAPDLTREERQKILILP